MGERFLRMQFWKNRSMRRIFTQKGWQIYFQTAAFAWSFVFNCSRGLWTVACTMASPWRRAVLNWTSTPVKPCRVSSNSLVLCWRIVSWDVHGEKRSIAKKKFFDWIWKWILNFFRWGRRRTLGILMIFGGVSCLTVKLTPFILFPLLGKMAASATFTIIYVQAAELFPTVLRNSGIGLCSCFARIGGIVAPIISLTVKNYLTKLINTKN